MRAVFPLLPGLALVAALTAGTYALAALPQLALLGPLVIALLVGIAWRAALGLPDRATAGVRFSARTLLRIGIVLLGVRLDFVLLAQVGPVILLGNLLVVVLGLLAIDRLGSLLGVGKGLRLGIAIGTSVCGASAIVAAIPVIRAKDEDASVAVGIISVLGTIGVLGYTLAAVALDPPDILYGVLVGSTLQEVAQVLAAGYASGTEAGDLAVLVKLSRVALLAPALLGLSLLARRHDGADGEEGAAEGSGGRTPLVPGFLAGFLIVGVLNSMNVFPPALASAMQTASLLLTAAAMVGLGLGVDLAIFRKVGARALLLGTAGFAVLVGLMIPYGLVMLR